jgi:hypothetical protein
MGLELADQPPALTDAARQLQHGAQPRGHRYVFQWAHIHETQTESGFGDETHFHAPSSPYKKDVSPVTLIQLVGNRQGGNDVAASSATGNQNPQVRQFLAFLESYSFVKRGNSA